MKELRRRENKIKKTNLEVDKEAYIIKENEYYNAFMNSMWSDQLTNIITENKNNLKMCSRHLTLQCTENKKHCHLPNKSETNLQMNSVIYLITK